MLGSRPREFAAASAIRPVQIYSVNLAGRTLWGWMRHDRDGLLLASSEQLFMDYVTCFCDAEDGIDHT